MHFYLFSSLIRRLKVHRQNPSISVIHEGLILLIIEYGKSISIHKTPTPSSSKLNDNNVHLQGSSSDSDDLPSDEDVGVYLGKHK